MNHDVLPPGSAAELQRLRTSNAELLAALERAFFAFGRLGGNSVPVFPVLNCVSVAQVRAEWIAARAAIAKAIKE